MKHGVRVNLYIVSVILLAVFDELLDLRLCDLVRLSGLISRQLKSENVTLKYRVPTLSLYYRFSKLLFTNVEVMYTD